MHELDIIHTHPTIADIIHTHPTIGDIIVDRRHNCIMSLVFFYPPENNSLVTQLN